MQSENHPANVGQVEVAASTLIQFLKGYGTGGRITPDAQTSRGGSLRETLSGLRAVIDDFLAQEARNPRG
jgi:hypothetical protein